MCDSTLYKKMQLDIGPSFCHLKSTVRLAQRLKREIIENPHIKYKLIHCDKCFHTKDKSRREPITRGLTYEQLAEDVGQGIC